jgi:hypothetical protein
MEKEEQKIISDNILLSLDAIDGLFGLSFIDYKPRFYFRVFYFNDKVTFRRQTINAKLKTKKFRALSLYDKKLNIYRDSRYSSTLEYYSKNIGVDSLMKGIYVEMSFQTILKINDCIDNFKLEFQKELENVIYRLEILNDETGFRSQVVNFDLRFVESKYIYVSFDLFLDDEYQIIPHQVIKRERE